MATLSLRHVLLSTRRGYFMRARGYQTCRIDVKSTRFKRQPRNANRGRPGRDNQ
jgi:hypothetical protein